MRKQNPYVRLFKPFLSYSQSKKIVVMILGFSIVSKVISLLAPYVLGRMLNEIQIHGTQAANKVVMFLVILLCIELANRFFHGFSRIRENKNKFFVLENFRLDIFQKVSQLPLQWHTDNHSGKTISRIEKAGNALRNFAGNQFMYMDTIIFSVGSLISLAFIWWKGALVVFLLSFFALWVVQKFDVYLMKLIRLMNEKHHTLQATMFDFISNMKTVITLRFEKRAEQSIKKKSLAILAPYQKHNIGNERKWFCMSVTLKISVICAIGWFIFEQFATGGVVLIGTVSMIIQYIQKMQRSMQGFAWQYSQITRHATDVESLEIIEKAYAELSPEYSLPSLKKRNSIAIEDLHFTYQDTQQKTHTLQGIHCILQPGKKIAIVGESGSGKSTFLSLLRGLYDVDHVNCKVMHPRSEHIYDHLHILSHNTSLIPQEPEIFEQTILFNLTIGLSFPQKQIDEYLEIARFADVVKDLPQGVDTDIKEKGVNLSGGQKQRLALARGLLLSQQSDILLLDEPTSSVDPINEQQIYQNIIQKFPKKCIVSAMHRLHLLDMFDEILVLHKGELVEYGSFTELSQANGVFARMRKKYQKHAKEN